VSHRKDLENCRNRKKKAARRRLSHQHVPNYLGALPAAPAGAAAEDEAAPAAAEAASAGAEAAPVAASAEGAGAGAAAGAGAGAGAGSSFLPQAASAAAAIKVASKSDFFISDFLLAERERKIFLVYQCCRAAALVEQPNGLMLGLLNPKL
jgi:hypothetical protein